jgi:FixJ family two-component response regulator
MVAQLISIIDDDPSVRDAVTEFVRSLGYDALAFASAEEFLACCDLERLACAITDIHMPGMNGFELKQQLDTRCGAIPVIMITARTEPDLETKAKLNGATCFLQKPFDAETLADCIEKALDR